MLKSHLESLEIAFEAVAEEDGLGGEHAQENGLNVADGRRHAVKIFNANPAEPEKKQMKRLVPDFN